MAFGKEKKEQEARARAERDAEAARRLEESKAQRTQAINEYCTQFAERVHESVRAGTPVSVFKDLYIPVDAQMNEYGPPSGLGLEALNALASEGWNVVTVIPRTYGGFQSYKISKTTAYGVSGWGKDEHKVGLGGHVVGVYALLSYTVTKDNLESSGQLIASVAKDSLPDDLTKPLTLRP